MVESINGINAGDYFKNSITEISKDYDFNGDGTVDIADYTLACITLNDDDETNDVKFTQEQLDNVFAAMIEAENKNQKYDNINDDNAVEVADEIIAAINSDATTPTKAKTLNQLQDIGRSLTKYIKECADLAKILAKKMEAQKKELDELEAEKLEKEEAYNAKTEEVNAKTAELNEAMVAVLKKSNKLSEARIEKSKQIVKTCIDNYAKGKCHGKTLEDYITFELAETGGFDVSSLQYELSQCTNLGGIIRSLCSDLTDIASDIRDISSKYNTKNAIYNHTVTTRNGILQAAQTASDKYQTGYQKRLDMRKEIVDKYYVESKGDPTTSANTQVQKLAEFLDNKEMDNMPFADAWAVLKESFGGVLGFNDKTHSISVPHGHDGVAKNIFSAFAKSLFDNYGVNADLQEEPEDGYVDPTVREEETPKVNWTDPISFTDGDKKYDFIIDKNNDGTFNDASEFLGAENGWAEMKQFDTNNDGVIKGDELKKLQVVEMDTTNGQFMFKNAADIGVSSIDLNSFKATDEADKLMISNDYNEGSFKVNMSDGRVLDGVQTLDFEQNLNNKYGVLFGASTEDANKLYDENPFMEEFKEKVDTDTVVNQAKKDIENNQDEAESEITATNIAVKHHVAVESSKAESEKAIQDKITAKKEQKAKEAKEEKIAEEKALEQKKQEEVELTKQEELKKEEEKK